MLGNYASIWHTSNIFANHKCHIILDLTIKVIAYFQWFFACLLLDFIKSIEAHITMKLSAGREKYIYDFFFYASTVFHPCSND